MSAERKIRIADPLANKPAQRDIAAPLDHSACIDNLTLQGKKIQDLLQDNEALAAQRLKSEQKMREALDTLERLKRDIKIAEDHALSGALPLNLDSDAAIGSETSERINLTLLAYYRSMLSPGHRFVSFLERKLRCTYIGRKFLRLLDMIYVFLKG